MLTNCLAYLATFKERHRNTSRRHDVLIGFLSFLLDHPNNASSRRPLNRDALPFAFSLHIMRPGFDARYVALILRVRGGHVRVAHLRARVGVVCIVRRGYVLHRGQRWLKLVIPDHFLRPVLPGRLSYRLLRTVSLTRPFDFLLVSGTENGPFLSRDPPLAELSLPTAS